MSDAKASSIARPDRALVDRAAAFPSATLHEAMGRKGALPYEIKPIAPKMKVCGPAVTVSCPAMQNLAIHRAIYMAEPGDVLVVTVGGAYGGGYWGEIMTYAARQRKIAGLVIDGCVRDKALIESMGFPVFARGLSIRGTLKDEEGCINLPVAIGDVVIAPGDLMVGDEDGLVVVPHLEIRSAIEAAEKREQKEEQFMKELDAGKSTLEILGLK
ncbi:MAG TPA: 4-carboxy-4-hydroxy-2-oxoadipate aldolase/oxaloacetate decarboxylase [Candidatus Binatia bacterium]